MNAFSFCCFVNAIYYNDNSFACPQSHIKMVGLAQWSHTMR